ncbi:Bug family tripartite tricarboxylate transporter substrate binding protein [Roseomonas elaeocarpi]|uniref:Bug family tripartite tricarboxylate transporter substrate binding protein n=1 Tax=Roseomonas elaeocarpi TaxID=907779 RepID=A0ABV6JPH0_9PROT
MDNRFEPEGGRRSAPTEPATGRRTLLRGAAALLALPAAAPLLAAPRVARAQGKFPDHPIRIVVPFAAGGVADLTIRAVANPMAERLGQPVVVDNRPGAGGITAAQQVMGAPADGHTLMAATNGTAISRSLFKSLPFDPLRDFAPIVTLGAFPIAVLVAPNSPIRTLKDLTDRMRAEPGAVNIGTINAGSTQNLSAELFKIRTGLKAETVAFPATPQLITSLLRGDVDVAFEITAPLLGQVNAGALRAIAVTSAVPSESLPGAPTLQSLGVANYDVTSWNALVARTGTPPAAIAAINAAANAVLAMPSVREVLSNSGVEPRGGTPEAMRQLLASDTARWAEVIETAGIPRQ